MGELIEFPALPGDAELRAETVKVERNVHTIANLMQLGSGLMAGVATYLHMSADKAPWFMSISVSTLTAAMTTGGLLAFTAAVIRIFPKLRGGVQAAAAVAALGGIAAFSVVSGTSNATVLGYAEAKALTDQQYLSDAEEGFQDAQQDAAQIAQIIPILTSGRDVAGAMTSHEENSGESGSGRGPIYAELVSQETRLAALEGDLKKLVADTQPLIRSGQSTLERIRESLKNPKMDEDHRQAALENGLMRLSSIAIGLRQQMPFASMHGIADMLSSPIGLQTYSTDPDKRRIQEETVQRLQSEFEPIGNALRNAVTAMEEETQLAVPVYQRRSPTQMVFAHAEELWFIIGVGYALDILPFLSVALILLARRQLGEGKQHAGAVPVPLLQPRQYRKRRPSDTDGGDPSNSTKLAQ